jgi:hypothetical protein
MLQGIVRAKVFGTPLFVPLMPMTSAAFIIFTLYMIPDPATAAAALQTGEIDWVEQVSPDIVQVLRSNRNPDAWLYASRMFYRPSQPLSGVERCH